MNNWTQDELDAIERFVPNDRKTIFLAVQPGSGMGLARQELFALRVAHGETPVVTVDTQKLAQMLGLAN